MFSRNTQVVAGIGVFILISGMAMAAVLIAENTEYRPTEYMWFRIEGDSITDIKASVYIHQGGLVSEGLLYIEENDWLRSVEQYMVGDFVNISIYFWYSDDELILHEYRIGHGPVAIELDAVTIEMVSHWEVPDI